MTRCPAAQVSEHHWNRTGWTLRTGAEGYTRGLVSHTFCLSPAGGGYTLRSVQALIMGCIPVLVGDGLHQPFQPELDWGKFSIRVAERDIPRMHEVLALIDDNTVRVMQVRSAAALRCFVASGAANVGVACVIVLE